MSIGVVVSGEEMTPEEYAYFLLAPEYTVGGMYSFSLFVRGSMPKICGREEAIADISDICRRHGITEIFAYNAVFDKFMLRELHSFCWRDIMSVAAYAQYNTKIPVGAPLYSTGRLKRGYGVQSVMRMLTGARYFETHNALYDALDELEIMRLLGCAAEKYGVVPAGKSQAERQQK